MDSGDTAYANSVDSSPSSRGGDSWDEPLPASASASASRLRLMCSYGGRIVPRPTDKSLCYLGGETRIVVADRHSSLAALSDRLSRSLSLVGFPFVLKYQLPNEDLDSLISVSTDEDLDNMIDEYDRILASPAAAAAAGTGAAGGRSSRLRLFLFPSKTESAPSAAAGTLLDDSKQTETWFFDALNNSAIGMSAVVGDAASSVNCLLGLEDDDSSAHSRGSAAADQILRRPDSSGKLPSVPDSPMLETSSSFGSASSAPSLCNLPPIRVRTDDRPAAADPRAAGAGLEEHFAHAGIAVGVPATHDGVKEAVGLTAPQPLAGASAVATAISPSENQRRVFSDDEKSENSEHGGSRRLAPPSKTLTSPPSEAVSRPVYSKPIVDPKFETMVTDAAGNQVLFQAAMSQAEQLQQHHQLHYQQQQQQFIHASGPHYIHHSPAPGTMLPMHPCFTFQQPPAAATAAVHQHFPVYYVPVQPGPAAAAPPPPPSNQMPALTPPQLAVARPAAPLQPPPPLIHVAADQGYADMGYHVVHHQPPGFGGYVDPTRSHAAPMMYYAQAPPYQPVSSSAAIAEAQSPPGDEKKQQQPALAGGGVVGRPS